MKIHFSLLFLAIFTSGLISAQRPKLSAEADFTGGLAFNKFTYDSLVATNRRGGTSLGSDIVANVYFIFSPKMTPLRIRTGIGYAERDIVMNKYSIGDFFVAIFSFDSSPRSDSFKLNHVDIKTRYVNVPVGISYNITKTVRHAVHFHVGLQLNASFRAGSKANIQFDDNYSTPTPQQQQAIKIQYEATASSFVLGIQPRFDIRIRIYKQLGIQSNLFPFTFYGSPWNKRLSGVPVVFGSGLGIQYNF